PSRLRDSSRAGGWRGVNRGWGPIRCTWGNNKPDRTKTQQKIIQLHGYRSRPISRNLAEISIAYVIGKREAAVSHHALTNLSSNMMANWVLALAPFAWRHFPCLRDLAQDE